MEGSGLPLLSGPPPSPPNLSRADIGCRKCSKEFNILFSRGRKCNHCGYSYCHSCTDYQALMPRDNANGYESVHVCGFCIEYLTITAARKSILKTMPLAKLRKYAGAYNINIQHSVEKDDIIDILVAARGGNGCLSPANETFYRTYSVPDRYDYSRPRGMFSRSGATNTAPVPPPRPRTTEPTRREFARPDLAPDDPPPVPPRPRTQTNTPPRSSYNPRYTSPPPPSFNSHPHRPPEPPRTSRPVPTTRSSSNPPPTTTTPRPRTASTTPLPPPSLEQLLEMPTDSFRSLSISQLKAVLFTNHVNAGTGVLEKDDLIKKVVDLVENEKRDRERARLAEEQERIEIQRRMMEEHERKMKEKEEKQREEGEPAEPSSSPPKPTMPFMERGGLCVICQDDEANIAIVDCGHLAMCRSCSDLVMSSSKECPLCRTRIVTEARLLRIFKT